MGKLSCFRGDSSVRSLDIYTSPPPDHIVIMVNGIIGSPEDWSFAAKQFFKTYPRDVIVHCSECNYSVLTFDGVDVLGNRLADEVLSVISRYPDLRKISFVSHSLGGLVSRYAIAKLYENSEEKLKGKIAGLEPVNFITFATPHLGSRGHNQAPFFCGLYNMETFASRISSILGRSGKHLFLKDGKNKTPLLLQMVKDNDELPFISALKSFKRRVAYANARFDLFVGWSTSSLRRRSELPKRRNLSRSEIYPHIINVETARSESTQEDIDLEAYRNRCKTVDIEEAMIRALRKMTWERVDVDFKGSIQRIFAHSTIQVKNYTMNSDGVDVIQHMIDNFWL